MTIYAEPPEVVPGQVMSATNWKDWVVDVAKAMWVYSAAGDIAYALSANQKARLAIGASQSLLMSNGSAPAWLAKGAANQVLGVNAGGTALEWRTVAKGTQVVAGSLGLSNAVLTVVPFTWEIRDEINAWTSGFSTRLTIPQAGWYLVGAYVSYDNNSNGRRLTNIIIDGTTEVAATDMRNAVSGGVTNVSLGNPIYLTAGRYIELQVYQTSGGSLAVTSSSLYLIQL